MKWFGSKPEWDEVVETVLSEYDEIGGIFHEFDSHKSIPVRIKCRRGAILIERLRGGEVKVIKKD
jgi:hypothetical protein